MPSLGLFITGTDTGVGKTWAGVGFCRFLQQTGVPVSPRKPVESGCEKSVTGEYLPADATQYFQACGQTTALETICPYRYSAAIAPDQAAEREGQTLTLEMLTRACEKQSSDQFLLVEGAGGFYSPIASNALNADLAKALGLPLLLVSANRLGTINHTLLTAEAIHRRGLTLSAVLLNQTEATIDPEMDNAAALKKLLACPVFSIGHQENNNDQWQQRLIQILDLP